MQKTLWYRLPVVFYCALIFWQSSFASPASLPGFAFSDKLLHLGGYGVLGFLVIRALWREGFETDGKRLAMAAIAFSTLYGLSDEIHQSFVSQRSAQAGDLAADAIGSCLGVAFFLLGKRVMAGKTARGQKTRNI
ncbi:MAG TPA: VanZ family protein [Desulfobacteraceae bacterium]|nr:VanZ family protein [Desulfobacteraceae bacterium]